ncbi:hypothetical protein [Agrobacterium pusense]|uniref:hypothetical protein n=1 Tax=Agrobacterium pusense TaxID=648995 RepID=UPI0011B1CE63|nr:hypothetical protein [Agrobacterium pusense]
MGSAVIGSLRVNLGLNTAEFEDGVKRSTASAGKFGQAMKVAFTAAAAGAAAALATVAVSLKNTLGAVDEITKSAQISNAGFEDFQRLAFAARSVGIEGDKLADIFKDVNDRIGDFNQTGGGPMKDFFDNIAPKVGITAEAFKNLSGPQALQLYYDSLKKAGANQQQMTFYLEAMSSDLTALIPLLENGGAGFQKLGAQASVISEEAGGQLRQFNQSVRNLGQGFGDLALGFVGALAPALVVVGNGFEVVAAGMRSATQILPAIAEHAAVAAAALGLMAAPAIVASITGLTVAIGTGLVGAVKALGAVIVANPIGALVVGIAAAVTAVYHFRDEIQKAIGVDVVGIAKRAGNLVIGSFVAAYEDIKFLWGSFPSIISAAVIGAANAVIRTVNDMVSKVQAKINDMISGINSITGAGLELLNTGPALREIENKAAQRVADAVNERGTRVQAAMTKDWIGSVGEAFKVSTPAVLDFGKAVGAANKQLAAGTSGSGGKKGKTDAESYAEIIDKANRRIATLKAEQQAIGLTEEAAAELRYQTDLLNMAQQRGIELSSAQKSELSGLASAMAGIEVATEKMRDALDFAKDATNGFLSDFRQGLENGKGWWSSFGDAALNVISKIADRIQTKLVDVLFSGGGSSGGSGGLLGGLFKGLFSKVPGFATGGTILPGGSGGIDSQLVMFRKSPTERVDITKPGQSLSSASVQGGTSSLVVSLSPDLEARVLDKAANQSVRIVKASESAQKDYYRNGGNTQ